MSSPGHTSDISAFNDYGCGNWTTYPDLVWAEMPCNRLNIVVISPHLITKMTRA